jgi:hypothetical protein
MKWNFSKNARRAGFIYMEDGSVARFGFEPGGSLELAGHRCLAGTSEARQTDMTRGKLAAVESKLFEKLTGSEWVRDTTWKQDPLSTAPEAVKFDRDGHLNWRRGQQDTWTNGAAWSLINRGGPFILLHCSNSALAPYPFANESFVSKINGMFRPGPIRRIQCCTPFR